MKTKTKTIIKIILIVALVFGVLAIYENHKDQRRADYANRNNCTWVVYGSHDVCK